MKNSHATTPWKDNFTKDTSTINNKNKTVLRLISPYQSFHLSGTFSLGVNEFEFSKQFVLKNSFFLNSNSLHARLKQPLQGMELQDIETKKIRYKGNLFRKNLVRVTKTTSRIGVS